jgi:hypothetical protein
MVANIKTATNDRPIRSKFNKRIRKTKVPLPGLLFVHKQTSCGPFREEKI